MFCPGTATLADGRLLITGGLSGPKSTFYDPYTDTWSSGPDMNIGRGYQSQVTLSSGMVFVLGGSWAPYSGVGGKSGEVYDPATNTWTVKPGIPASGTINTEDIQGEYRSDNHMWFFEAANGKILHAGPSKYMHWIDLAGDGSVVEAG
jgi:galactose oxidase